MNYLIGIDVGTSATKTVLFDENGQIKGSVSCEYPLYQPENGWAEQKAEDWRDAVLKTLKECDEVVRCSCGRSKMESVFPGRAWTGDAG